MTKPEELHKFGLSRGQENNMAAMFFRRSAPFIPSLTTILAFSMKLSLQHCNNNCHAMRRGEINVNNLGDSFENNNGYTVVHNVQQ